MKVASHNFALIPQAERPALPKGPVSVESSDGYTPSEMGADFSTGKLIAAAGVTVVAAALGYAAGNSGGFAGGIVGGITGVATGAFAIGRFGNGKGGDGLIYPVVGAVAGGIAGAVLGAIGGDNGAIVGAAAGLAASSGFILD